MTSLEAFTELQKILSGRFKDKHKPYYTASESYTSPVVYKITISGLTLTGPSYESCLEQLKNYFKPVDIQHT